MSKQDIYIVDDTADYRFLLQQIFTRFLPQYTVRFFSSGDELRTHLSAVDASGRSPAGPDLILLDLNMPGISGYETLLFLKQHTRWQQIPVVMMTNTGSVEEVEQCYKAGANSFLTKPGDFMQLKQVIETLCNYWLVLNKFPSPAESRLREQ